MNRKNQPFYPLTNMWLEWCSDDEPEEKTYWMVLGYFMEYYEFGEEDVGTLLELGVNLYYLVINDDGYETLFSGRERLIYSTINPNGEDDTFRAYTSPDYTKSNGEELLALSIDKLALSCRTRDCLRSENIESVNDLVNSSERKIMQINNIGKKKFQEIKDVLSNHGLSLAGD